MKKTLYLFIMLLLVAGATDVTRAQINEVKKCKTCGDAIAACPYKGNHPKCKTCGKIVDNCIYNGKHPKCKICGKAIDKCRYKGTHPKCQTCGKIVDYCTYKGKHPKCKTCGKIVDHCTYKGKHPKCKTCGKIVDNCIYNGNHPAPTPTAYDVRFNCNATDAMVYVDGKKLGTVNRSYSVPTGRHDVKLVAEGYEPYTTTITVNAEKNVDFKMEKSEFDVLISSNVQKATITVDGEELDNPGDIIKMKPGNHSVKIVSSGYNDTTAVISVDESHTSFKFDLTREKPASSNTGIRRTYSETQSSSQSTSKPQSHGHYIDWDVDFESIGLSYSYSKYFPLAIGLTYTINHVSFGGEFGINLDKKKLYPSDVETVSSLKYFIFTPGFYCKFFSINCGIGAFSYNYEKSGTLISGNEAYGNSGSSSTSVIVSETTEEPKGCLLLKPSITGHIPISDGEHFITLNVGYLYIPKFKELNGLTFGVGFQFVSQ